MSQLDSLTPPCDYEIKMDDAVKALEHLINKAKKDDHVYAWELENVLSIVKRHQNEYR